ncbi:MAG: TraB/GumN family protein [Lentisphaeria bacterium]|nr:TraB/GumN family protein [Lentisphaeria bacterium]
MKRIALYFIILFVCGWYGVIHAQTAPQKQTAALIWEVTHPAKPGKLYLAGTVHACRPEMYPLDSVYDDTLAKSDYLVFEIAYPSPFAAMGFMMKQGFYPRESQVFLPDMIGNEVFRDLCTVIQKTSPMMNQDRLKLMKPWTFFSLISAAFVQQEGFQTIHGMEKVIQRFVANRNMEMRSLETVASQLAVIAAPEQEADIIFVLKDFYKDRKKALEELKTLLEVYRTGNDTLLAELNRECKEKTPRFYQALIVARNQAMTDKLFAMLAEKKTGMVLVGLAHFCGSDSIRAMLEKKGCRIQTLKYHGKPGKITAIAK